jgi:23S rRNA-/tRNA-specific pseudouridylate synthase
MSDDAKPGENKGTGRSRAERKAAPPRPERPQARPARPPADAPDDPARGERIAKWLARAGVASRRDAEKIIAEGRVRLNRDPVTQPATFVQPGDVVSVDNKPSTSPSARGCSATTSPPG